MKKILAGLILAVSIIVMQTPQVEAAKEEYMGKYATGYDVYLLLDSYNVNSFVNLDFTCKVKATNGYDVQYIGYHFWLENGAPYFSNSDGFSGRVTDDMQVEANIFKFTAVMAMKFMESQRQ